MVDGVYNTFKNLVESNDPRLVAKCEHEIVGGVTVFFAASFLALMNGVRATYGRYTTTSQGPVVPGILDWIGHALAIVGVALVWPNRKIERNEFAENLDFYNVLCLAGFVAHYVNRSFVHPLRVKSIKPIPLLTLILTSSFCLINGILQGRHLTFLARENGYNAPDMHFIEKTRFWFGACVFVFGFVGNVWHDSVLMSLRSDASDDQYRIPHGGLFHVVSAPNFLCEIVEWIGFAVACDFSEASLMFAACTAFNLVPRALHHHAHYQELFQEKYPRRRRALIPFLL